MGIYHINGLTFTQHIAMPDRGQIILADWGALPEWSKQTALHFWNHSLFRLNKNGEVIWQVKRHEVGRLLWAQQREKAEAENSDDPEMRSPFLALILQLDDGRTNRREFTDNGPPIAQWVEGVTVICRTLDSMAYELDVDTGIAVNITPLGGRPW